MTALAEPIAKLEARWGEPPKTSGNSSLPPSAARKANRRSRLRINGQTHWNWVSRVIQLIRGSAVAD